MKEKRKYEEDHAIKKHNKTIKDYNSKKNKNKEKKKYDKEKHHIYDKDYYNDHTKNDRHGNRNKDDKYRRYNNESVYYSSSRKTGDIENDSDTSDRYLKNKKKHSRRSNSSTENDYKNDKGNKSKSKKLGYSYNSFDYFNESIEKNKLSHKYIVEEKLKYEKDVFEKAYGLSLQSDAYFDNFLFDTKSNEKSKNKNTGQTSMQYECYSCKAKNYYSNVQCYKCKKLRKN
ncbi:conserved Plasmodium protein, unknown function [Plasmodium vinckei]|uniref:RanBP2-type domain-containing protein n=1 Tax=Plasmodium vinckei TaxID=5860 RepID=A0A6V7SMR0_PLAVN|nr:conserved Plasmodium protein, unknown function [Plasmodium vinckei]